MIEADWDVFYKPRARAQKLFSRAVAQRVRQGELPAREDRVEAQVHRAVIMQYWEEMP